MAGTSSGSGKSTVVTGLCRCLARRGVSVAPFKAQNMSLNSFVTPRGAEIGRAQALQAFAARVEPEAAMNPVLLKPGADSRSQVIVMGRPVGEMGADEYGSCAPFLLDVVVDAYEDLRSRHDVVVCEGAGSPAEVNLRSSDIVNFGFARAVGAPVVLVGDIDRGGVFASFVGTLALLCPEDQRLLRGFVVNRFRGDVALLQPGLEELETITGRPTYGVLPYVDGLGLDTEDAPDPSAMGRDSAPLGTEVLRVCVIRLPRASNLTDLDPLLAEPGVLLRLVSRPGELTDADLVVLPGTRATVCDLSWLRSQGLDRALAERAERGLPILGLCGGFQMLGTEIEDQVESARGAVRGLGLLPLRTRFEEHKTLARPRRILSDGTAVEGYEIRHGETEITGAGSERCEAFFADEGCRLGAVAGTSWHGLFENDQFRRQYLTDVARRTGRKFLVSSEIRFEQVRERVLEALADLVEEHLDVHALMALLDSRPSDPEGSRIPMLTLSSQDRWDTSDRYRRP